MTHIRVALANIRYPSSPDESVALAVNAIRDAARAGAAIVCFPECYVPGYKWPGVPAPPPDAAFLERAWTEIGAAARDAEIAVILGTERATPLGALLTALVINADGTRAGFQDKVQLDPSEDPLYIPGSGRGVFKVGPLTFGIVICHEGFRYPETVRWAARNGAQVVFHPHYDQPEPGRHSAPAFADPANSFHEKAMLCRAAENTCFFASVNCAVEGASTTSAIARPNGTLLCSQPRGQEGLLVADLDLSDATGLLALRYRPA